MSWPGKRFLLYATESCGRFEFAPGDPDDQLELVKSTGFLDLTPNDVDRDESFIAELAKPRYAAVVEVVDDFDVLLGRSREPSAST